MCTYNYKLSFITKLNSSIIFSNTLNISRIELHHLHK